MKALVLNNKKLFGLFLSLYAIIGGFIGMYLVYQQVGPDTGLGTYIVLVPIGIIYLLSFWGGIAYHLERQRWRFFMLLKLVLCLQLIQFAAKGFTFIFFFGPYWGIGYDTVDAITVQFKLLNLSFSVSLGDAEVQSFHINAIAIFLLVILHWLERAEKESDQAEVDQFLRQIDGSRQQP